MERFRGGLVFKAHGLLNDSTLGSRVRKKEEKGLGCRGMGVGFGVSGVGCRVQG